MLNKIYLLAIFLLPFDNLIFAPSSGWATVTPIIFVIYILLNYKKFFIAVNNNFKGVSIIFLILIYSTTMSILNGIDITNVFDTIQTIILGLCIYFSLYIRYIINKCDYKADLKVLFLGYSLSIIYGVIKFISLKYGISIIISFFKLIEKRYYNRVAFSFTEPSFIAMHIYGVLLILYLNISDKLTKKRIKSLIIIFTIIALISKSSSRFLLDTVIMLLILNVNNILKKQKNFLKKITNICGMIFIFGIITFIALNNTRIKNTISNIYSDPSMASRLFRVEASIYGYKKHPYLSLVGSGLGSSYYFLHEGYWEAYNNYTNNYMKEVNELYIYKPNQLFCMYIRLISEFGIVITIYLITFFIFKCIRGNISIPTILISFYLYIQMDSYTFYTIPLILFICNYSKQQKIE